MPQPKEPITTALVEALHFRTGFHYIMVREMEMQIPIPSLPGKLPLICKIGMYQGPIKETVERSHGETNYVLKPK